jgi:hypothetical protein
MLLRNNFFVSPVTVQREDEASIVHLHLSHQQLGIDHSPHPSDDGDYRCHRAHTFHHRLLHGPAINDGVRNGPETKYDIHREAGVGKHRKVHDPGCSRSKDDSDADAQAHRAAYASAEKPPSIWPKPPPIPPKADMGNDMKTYPLPPSITPGYYGDMMKAPPSSPSITPGYYGDMMKAPI